MRKNIFAYNYTDSQLLYDCVPTACRSSEDSLPAQILPAWTKPQTALLHPGNINVC